ncbi:MAG: hypothetical protein LBF33_01835 [Oscillospiraceae bacterium]|nr:hypothetical protein [Oscillospiraceae bacterium]
MEELKKQLVSLQKSGKSVSKVANEYSVSKSTLATWI